MSTHNIPFSIENHPKLSYICSYGIFSKGLKNKFETAVVNMPSVFKPLKVYCIKERNARASFVNLYHVAPTEAV